MLVFDVESCSFKLGSSQQPSLLSSSSVLTITGGQRREEIYDFTKTKKRELESVRIAGGQELECRMEIPACARENLLESARAGKVETRLFQQLARLGLFYLEEVFNVCLYQVF